MRSLLVMVGLLAWTPSWADTYCIWIVSSVSGEQKVHRCAWFNTYEQCVEAAKKVGGVCKPK